MRAGKFIRKSIWKQTRWDLCSLACADGGGWEEKQAGRECCRAGDEGVTCSLCLWGLQSTLSPREEPVSQSSAQGGSCRLLPIQPCQKGGHHSRAKRTGARQSEGSPPQGADERVLLSKFTISSCALMLWDKAVTLQYKTTWKHSATALSFPCWNSAAANNTGTGTTWLLFQLLWAYTNQMPNQPMDKIAQNVPSGIEAIVNKIQNVQRYFLQPELLLGGKRKEGEKETQTTRKEPTGIYCSGLSR